MTIIQTQRLSLRYLISDDFNDLSLILKCPITMKYYEHSFSDDEVAEWLARQLQRYENDGFGLFAVIRKSDGLFIGQAGITIQDVCGKKEHEIGYLFNKYFWHKGYATEAAIGCKDYAFNILGLKRITSIIRDTNTPSQAVAKRVGMVYESTFIKHYYGIDMPHMVYGLEC